MATQVLKQNFMAAVVLG